MSLYVMNSINYVVGPRLLTPFNIIIDMEVVKSINEFSTIKYFRECLVIHLGQLVL
jgi:hypothetical protein